jgi:hypothetical protein
MNELDHEQLDVDVAWADEVVERLPRGRAYVQMVRRIAGSGSGSGTGTGTGTGTKWLT